MKQAGIPNDKNVYVDGGIIRTDPSKKQITLVFTAADKADGADAIISTLKKHGIKGGFFFTGEFYELYPDVVKRLLDEGHFVGSHSYGHLLYMPWEDRDSLLVTREEFENDMMKSYETLRKASIEYKDAPVYIPPYEYYNKEISAWAKNMGIQVINIPWYHEQCRLHHSGHGTEVPEQQIHLQQDYGGGKERRSERTPNADTLRNGRPPHRQVL